ncbi:MAG: MotA/TolQ/ExbB proton channel family protein [Planctomycetota bacterium]|jgi:biopolymer transport protein ExbB
MHRNFLLKVIFLVIALASVSTVIAVTMRSSFGTDATGVGQTQTFFGQFVVAGGPIVWFVLLPMSLVTVFLAVEYSLTIRRAKLVPGGIGERIVDIIRARGPGQLEERISEKNDFVSVAAVKAITHGRGDWFRMRNVLAESLQEQAWRFLRRIEWINLIGNVSPMVGLFGTVFGMIKLFNAIDMTGGQLQPELAEGISVALVTTFWGLFIAIPALAIHGVFRNRIETLINDAVVESENIVPEIRRSLKKQKQAEAKHATGVKQPIRELGAKPVRTSIESLRPQK